LKPSILVIDDEEAIRSSLRMILEHEGYRFMGAGSGKEGLEQVAASEPDLILLDIKMPRMDGLEVLSRLRDKHPSVPVVMVSAHGTIATAVEAIRTGAFAFMEKPLERDVVLLRVGRALESRQLKDEVHSLRLQYEERFRMVGGSAALEAVRQSIARAAPVKSSVLITGESGTGKELVARAIHRNSPHADRPFVRVNCAAIPDELIESELFGHEKGSFTGAVRDQVGKFVQADGGTVFLDEVGDMSLKTQAKVLRVLQDGEVEPIGKAKSFHVDVRVIAATNKDLQGEIGHSRFREDLYYRLNVVPIAIPPLRDRKEDVATLVEHFAVEFCRENNYKARSFPKATIEALGSLPWPGNVRELRNAVERLIIMSDGAAVTPEEVARHLPGREPAVRASAGTGAGPGGGAPAQGQADPAAATGGGDPATAETLQGFKDAAERTFIVRKLRENDWNITATARVIDTPRSNLYKKLEHYNISKETDG
jgi:two-component system nitrogen regulation response regulator NtrX